MDFLEKIEKLASIFLLEAQTLGLGESSLSIEDMKTIATNLKIKVQQLISENKIEHHIYHWTNPGDKLLSALDKMSNGLPLDSNLKSSAIEDYNQNVAALLDEESKTQLTKLFSTYNRY